MLAAIEIYYLEDGHFFILDLPRGKIAELDYLGYGAFAPATKKQRQFIHGLCDELGYDCKDLPFSEPDVYNMTILEASEAIEFLKDERDSQRHEFGGYRNKSLF